jgi:zinc transport system substrate-binding protein
MIRANEMTMLGVVRAASRWRGRSSFAVPITVALLALGPMSGPATAAAKVVASIKPVHSLVAAVMEGAGEPSLLVRGGSSPHSYNLRPSEARGLSNAELVFWVGEGLESFLAKPLKALASQARVVELAEAPGIVLLAAREGGAWEDQDKEESGHEADGHRHGPGESNPHIWLDPLNAKRIVAAAVDALADLDPSNEGRYRRNGAAVGARLDALDAELQETFRPVKEAPFIVFHDAYHYIEARYDLRAVGSITVSPDRAPGAKRLREIRRKILDAGAACVFSEPQFQPALVETVVQGTPAKTAVLDPMGADLAPGPEAYFELMRNLATALTGCLTPAS